MKTLKRTSEKLRKGSIYMMQVLLVFVVFACNDGRETDKVAADFEFVEDDNNSLIIEFINKSENASSYEWDFGDGAVSFAESPTHTYEAAGTYNVTLTVSNDKDFSQSIQEVEVYEPPLPYSDYVYSTDEVVRTANIQYGSHEIHNLMDLYQVPENQEASRPLILLSPGGGFLKYNRTEELADMAKDLARRGYVVAIVKYTVDSELDRSNSVATSRIWMQAMQDQKSAIRFFKNSASEYRIDPEKVFIGGWSNGATVALTTGFLQEEEVVSIANESMRTLVNDRIAELGFEGTENLGTDSSVKGALILNGYAFGVDFIDANDPALMIIYHQNSRLIDGTMILETFDVGEDTYYGLIPIKARAKSVGYVENDNLMTIIMTGFYDEPNYAPLEAINYDDIADFFYQNLE